jgi:universal stress protein A
VPFKNILCPVDFSSASRHALTVATELAVASSIAITIVYVWQPPMYGSVDSSVSGDVLQSMMDDDARSLTEWEAATKVAGVKTRSQFVRGVPVDEIVQLLEQDRTYDLVVMSTHGRTGLSHVVLGSVAEKVVRHAPCAVLVVR